MKIFIFFYKILHEIFYAFFHKPTNNYDFARFPISEKKNSSRIKFCKIKMRNYVLWLMDIGHFIFRSRKFFKAYQLLNDQESKILFIRLIVYKILGQKYIQIKANHDWGKEKELLDAANQFCISKSEITLKAHPEFGGLNFYEGIPTEIGTISLDCWLNGVACLAMKKQYYFSRNGITIKPELGNIVIDCGGCFGDTSIFFAKSVGPNGKVYVFDPLPIHGTAIRKNISQNNLDHQVTYLPYAISDLSNNTNPSEDCDHTLDPGFRLRDTSSFPIISIDDFVKSHSIDKIDFIKMDIEGHELLALQGATRTIQKFTPKLAISIYHRKEDFYAIPLWISKITDQYQYYIDHYTLHAEETVLYAIPK